MRPDTCRTLLVYPRFSPGSFWNYQATCEVVGARYLAAPLGLITVAAMLPPEWDLRLIDRNTGTLTEADLDWADLVMTGGMLPQQRDALRVIELAHARAVPVVVGGPDVTCSPHVYEAAEFRVLGEAEEILPEFLAAWRGGATGGSYRASCFPDIRTSPIPRFDLLALEHYMHVGMQISRGCPYSCEFCNVIELNGRVPRVKTAAQVTAELDALYALGYRGHVDFVDDNLIGNRKEIKPVLAALADWLRRHRYPYEFSTEASINLADDDELLALMREANFFAVFVGIETPDPDILASVGKLHNTRRDIPASIRKIQESGIFVNAGFIIGFDTEKQRVADSIIACIEDAAIPVCMVGLLYALPQTRLSRRLSAEGRLRPTSDRLMADTDADQGTSGLNFDTRRPRIEILEDFRTVLQNIYDPNAFFGRTFRMARRLDRSAHHLKRPVRRFLRDLRSLGRIAWRLGVRNRLARGPFWRAMGSCLVHNPAAVEIVAAHAALYLHLQSYARRLDRHTAERMTAEA